MKTVNAVIVRSSTYPGQVSLRDGELRDIRFALSEVFHPGEEVVVVRASDWQALLASSFRPGRTEWDLG